MQNQEKCIDTAIKLESCIGNAKVMCELVLTTYFGNTKPDLSLLAMDYERIGQYLGIVNDYLHASNQSIQPLLSTLESSQTKR